MHSWSFSSFSVVFCLSFLFKKTFDKEKSLGSLIFLCKFPPNIIYKNEIWYCELWETSLWIRSFGIFYFFPVTTEGSYVRSTKWLLFRGKLDSAFWCDKHQEMIEVQEDEKRKQIIVVFSRFHLNIKEWNRQRGCGSIWILCNIYMAGKCY